MSNYEKSVSDDSILDTAARALPALIDNSTGDADDVYRDAGLNFTKEQLLSIRRYEVAGLALPTTLNQVIGYLGYSTGAGRGLEASDFKKSFEIIHAHASTWNPLRVDLMSVAHNLELFAGQMVRNGKSMKDIADSIGGPLELRKLGIRTLEDLRQYEMKVGHKFPDLELDEWDKESVSDFGFILDIILQGVKQREAEAQGIKARLDAFAFVLHDRVGPEIRQKLRAIDNNTLSDDVKALNTTIENRAKDIDEKNKEYKDAVKQAVGSAAGGNIIGLAMAIYVGVAAEKIRKERDKLKDQQASDIAVMQTKNRILGSLNRVRLDMQELDGIIIEADTATQNLVTAWNHLIAFIAQSSSDVDQINDALSVNRFLVRFYAVVEPWNEIREQSRALNRVFIEANQAFVKEYQTATKRFGAGA